MRAITIGVQWLVALAVVVAGGAWALPAHAAPTAARTITLSEAQINKQYWVTNPRGRAVTNRSVDLQPGQVVINDTLARPRQKTVQVSATIAPTLSNGRVTWALTAATVDGQPASAELVGALRQAAPGRGARQRHHHHR
jgi:hypothetical protein